MTIPGFTAEISLFSAGEKYQGLLAWASSTRASAVAPQLWWGPCPPPFCGFDITTGQCVCLTSLAGLWQNLL
jgi:hypothetical protein